jgi:hypothetical protein
MTATLKRRQVYVALLDEGVEVWRPVDAAQVAGDEYKLSGPIPEGEVWEFQPDEVVRCRERMFSDGTIALVAVARVRPDV